MNKFKIFKSIFEKVPILQPIFIKLSNTFFDFIPKFSGWGMKTGHELPWNDEHNWSIFRKTHEEYRDTKKIVDEFFSDKSGLLLKLPTSQAIYFR